MSALYQSLGAQNSLSGWVRLFSVMPKILEKVYCSHLVLQPNVSLCALCRVSIIINKEHYDLCVQKFTNQTPDAVFPVTLLTF